MFIHHTGQYFSPDSRARVDVSPRRYKKIAINHEVRRKCSSLEIYSLLRLSVSSQRQEPAATVPVWRRLLMIVFR